MPTVTSRLAIVALIAAIMVGLAAAPVVAQVVNAGPIHNNQDAQTKCPQACGMNGWAGEWWSQNFTSYCRCGGPGAVVTQPAIVFPVGPGPSCSAEPTQACSGCSVACPAGQQAHCTGGQDTTGTPMCWTQAVCECRG